ncbi:MAG: SDR family NAD(P)-dependent oxidoreductase [Pseudomonadota bacterium]
MSHILVTGANKGIGYATVAAILAEHPEYTVILGARDLSLGSAARERLLETDPAWAERLVVQQLDVTSQDSVDAARAAILSRSGDSPALVGLVNNAGRAVGGMQDILDVNVYGIHRVTEAFAPLMAPGGRVVNVASAAGPNFVAQCSSVQQAFFTSETPDWPTLDALMRDCARLSASELAALGLGEAPPYGVSKACANLYTVYSAARWPELVINACTPGFIETDLATPFLGGRTPEEAGMKTPAEGARVILFLLFGNPNGSGHYFGSDSLRSPLDRYRAPGSPAFAG